MNFVPGGEQPWHVNFVNEEGGVAGGLTCDLMSEVGIETGNPDCGFVVRISNGRVLPIPAEEGPTRAKEYHMIGVLIVMAIRTGLVQPFLFPRFVWQFLVDGNITVDTIFEIDPP